MVIKVLLINFEQKGNIFTRNVEVTSLAIKDLLPLHDYHAVIIHVGELLAITWNYESAVSNNSVIHNIENLSYQLDELTRTGGWVFVLNNSINSMRLKDGMSSYSTISNDMWCPDNIELVHGSGDTFYVNPTEERYYSSLLDGISDGEISWKYYVSEYPENSRVIATNRANHAIFIEVPNGQGKYVLLPNFNDRDLAVRKIINKIIPQVIKEEAYAPHTRVDHLRE